MAVAEEVTAERVLSPSARRNDWFLVCLGTVLAVPYLLLGPGFVMDDWIHLRGLQFGGWMDTASYLREARPGAAAVFAITFGLFGDHPAVHYVMQTAVVTGAAVTFCHLLRRFVAEREAITAAGVWILLPIHSSIDHWAATLNVVVAVLFLLAGLCWLTDAVRGAPRWAHAGLALIVATLCYESVLTIALVATFLAWCYASTRFPPLMIGAGLLTAGAWMYQASTRASSSWFDFTMLPAGHFGAAAFGSLTVVAVPALLAGGLIALRRSSTEAAMIAAGLAVIVVGASVFARFSILELVGIGDRVNAVTSFGTALIVAAAFLSLTGRRVVATLGIAAVLMVPTRIERSQDYAWAAEQAVILLEASDPTAELVRIGPCPTYRNYITPFQGPWDALPALQYHHNDLTLLGGYERNLPIGRWSPGEQCTRHPARR